MNDIRFDQTVAVIIIGRPNAPAMNDGETCEILRLCIQRGNYGVGSALIGRAWRAAQAIGYTRMISYVDADRHGTVFESANLKLTRQAVNGSWHNRTPLIKNERRVIKRFVIESSKR